MRRDRLSRLVVTDGGLAIGVIAVSDLVASLGAAHPAPRTVEDAMSRGIVMCPPETPYRGRGPRDDRAALTLARRARPDRRAARRS
jgi:CBS domain-containing protein